MKEFTKEQYFEIGKLLSEVSVDTTSFGFDSTTGEKAEVSMVSFEFNAYSKTVYMEFKKTQLYRTIVRYVQSNYVKTPIYSLPKEKVYHIKKTLKISNKELELLPVNSDEYIRAFRFDIVIKLDSFDFIPLWFKKACFNSSLSQQIDSLNSALQKNIAEKREIINIINIDTNKHTSRLYRSELALKKLNKKIARLSKKVDKINNCKKSVIKALATLFLFNILTSKKRLKKLNSKLEIQNNKQNELNKQIENFSDRINLNKKQADDLYNDISDLKKENYANILELKEEYNEFIDTLQPLNMFYPGKKLNDFTPLKQIQYYEKEKIIGVYVIKNNENNKCYVGQSKDILKRICQHFKGTEPKNIIFAKDYYNSENKDDLFSVKIIPLHTKDELDATEKSLIKEYDALNSGYNSTKGNA